MSANATIASNRSRICSLGQPEDRRVQVDVIAAAELVVEPAAQFQQGGDASADFDRAGRRAEGPGNDLQQGALAAPVASDDADALALGDVERDAAQGPELAEIARAAPA